MHSITKLPPTEGVDPAMADVGGLIVIKKNVKGAQEIKENMRKHFYFVAE